ncbi:oxidoreductase, membrane subunit [hydrothermal vent metagenome]|uniref:Oxidoreductase, membrane subunit n=1 Tax=hydrothermal vent metagenome TaxID=652676 RepID=A0A3B1DEX7_9ZZZZ
MTHAWTYPEALWTIKDLFVYPNEYIYWSIQIVMYPLMTGLVAGAFVLSSLYHVFGLEDLKDMAKFSLVFSFALLIVAPMPLMFHLQQPQRGMEVFFTPHFTSAISAFGIVFFSYSIIVASEIWFVYRKFFVEQSIALKGKDGIGNSLKQLLYSVLTLGAYDIGEKALHKDEKAIKILAGIGIPVACFLHGYAGFIFGSVKANALWMTPLMPVIFIMSAIVSGIALCMLTYIVIMEWRKFKLKSSRRVGDVTAADVGGAEIDLVRKTSKYLIGFMIAAITLEILDLIFRGYTAVKSWDILRSIIYDRDFVSIFILQYTLGYLVPFIMLLLPRLTIKRTAVALVLVIFGVFMMRWNVVIGGQAFSLSFAGYMEYKIPVIPNTLDAFKEGLFGALLIGIMPFILFWGINKLLPSLKYK